MFNLKKELENIQYYYCNDNYLLFYSENLYLNFNKITIDNVFGGSILSEKFIIANKDNKQIILNDKLEVIQEYENNTLFSDIFYKNNEDRIVSINTEFKDNGGITCNWVLFNFKDNKIIKDYKIKTNYCYPIFINTEMIIFQNSENLVAYNLMNSRILWKFNSVIMENEILGIYKNKIFVPTKNNSILTIDLFKGKSINKWHIIKGINLGSKDEEIIPNPKSFILDKKQSKLIGAFHKYYFEINVLNNKISYKDISEQLIKYNIAFIKQLNNNPFTNTHLFLTAMMMQKYDGKNFTFDCLFALNRKTLKIDWIHHFRKISLGNHSPKMTKNKLFQLDNQNTLHIFKKLEDLI